LSALPERLAPQAENDGSTSPQQCLLDTVESYGIQVAIKASLSVNDFFIEYSEEEMNSYASDVLDAIRTRNIDQLRTFLNDGRPLKCSNRFGESLIHLACRRGFVDVVSFLINDAQVPLKVRDDYGRTPLHDALWTCEPNFELVDLILSECPDLLYMKDRRGHTPLCYARREHWSAWNNFLTTRSKHLLTPRSVAVEA
jgi:hypothetical protein